MAHFDLLVRGARVIDPAQGHDDVADVAIQDGKVSGVGDFSGATADRIIEGRGLIASPGWIDLHVHVYKGAGTLGVDADRDAGVAKGVTTVIDTGSAGAVTWEGFREYVIERSVTRVLGYLNISLMRSPGPWHGDWQNFDQNLTIKTAESEAAAGNCIGIKILSSQRHVGNLGIIPLQLAWQASRMSNTRLMVHLGNPPPLITDVLNMLGGGVGDVVTHCWHGKGQGLLDRNNKPIPEVWAAAERGLRFDIGHGQSSFSFETARYAMEAGLPLHSISTDIHRGNLDGPVYDMATTMSKFLHLGFSLPDVIRLSTIGPAETIGRQDELGSLRTGHCADMTLFRVVDGNFVFTDSNKQSENASQRLDVLYTVRAGQVVKEPESH
jgi:dihydroorotase